jgi:hypothetical protein
MNTNKIICGDCDIDCSNRHEILSLIEHVPAKLANGKKHVTSVYVQDIEYDPVTGLASENFEESPYTKIDFLNLSFLSKFKSNKEINELMNLEPDWSMLMDKNIVKELPHIHEYYSLISKICPKSLNDLITILNKIREGSNYTFKKSHATAYALNIILMLNYFRKYNIRFREGEQNLSSELFNLN